MIVFCVSCVLYLLQVVVHAVPGEKLDNGRQVTALLLVVATREHVNQRAGEGLKQCAEYSSPRLVFFRSAGEKLKHSIVLAALARLVAATADYMRSGGHG